MSQNYVTVEEIKNTLELTGLTFADYDLEQAVNAASRGIDQYCGRRFYADTDATSERYYSPATGYVLHIDDIIAAGTLQTDEDASGGFATTWTENRDYVLEPFNAVADGKPYERIRVHPNGSYRFVCWPRSVKVTGQFGWPEIPAPVKQATTILAERLMRRARDAPFGVVALGFDQPGMQIPKLDPDVRFLLEPYVHGDGVLAA